MQQQYKTVFSAILLLWLPVTAQSELAAQPTKTKVDVFVSTGNTAKFGRSADSRTGKFTITFHTLDGIEHFESTLSNNLSSDPELAKRQVQSRLEAITKSQTNLLKRTAESLALAHQYGIDKYPAVVIDAHWVVYGVANVDRAIRLYQDWSKRRVR
jgi:integrating conjugative element protein (TIGR03757 family)